MPRFQQPKKEKAIPVGKTTTLHSFFGSAANSPQIHTPSTPEEIIIIDSGDENVETIPTQPKRKALSNLDTRDSSVSKKGKLSRNTAQLVPENGPPLNSVPSSSLNCSAGTVKDALYVETGHTQRMMTIVENWEMGDDEFFDLGDDSQAVGDEEDSPKGILDTCPVCGAIFVDFCLSVSIISSPLMGPHSSQPYSATASAHKCLY